MGKLEAEGLWVLSQPNFATLVAQGVKNNSIFDLADPQNRDDSHQPYYMLRQRFNAHGVEFYTSDAVSQEVPLFELHMNVQTPGISKFQYLLLLETPQIYSDNADAARWTAYRKVFTWNDQLVNGDRFIKINFPNVIRLEKSASYAQRSRFCCMISGNRAATTSDDRTLYGARVEAIRWFEANAPQEFELFGVDWDIPAARAGMVGKIQRRLWLQVKQVVNVKHFPSYRGKIARKCDVLGTTRFAICFENVRDLNGYITEKIFDCFFAGCVPVYWGAANISDYIPRDCFIDRRSFHDTADVYQFLVGMSETAFNQYQKSILEFLQSKAVYPFSSECFVETIVNTIMQDVAPQS